MSSTTLIPSGFSISDFFLNCEQSCFAVCCFAAKESYIIYRIFEDGDTLFLATDTVLSTPILFSSLDTVLLLLRNHGILSCYLYLTSPYPVEEIPSTPNDLFKDCVFI